MDVVPFNNLDHVLQTDILKGHISHPKDLMILGDFLFVSGQYYKRDYIHRFHLQEHAARIYESNVPNGDIMNLSVSASQNIMLILRKEILHLSINGDRLQEIKFGFNIHDALQLDHHHYVICDINNRIHLIDSLGNIMQSYSPPNILSRTSSPRSIARDSRGHILVNDHYSRNLFIFDTELNLKDIANVHESTRCIDYSNGALLALTHTRNLKVIHCNFAFEPNN